MKKRYKILLLILLFVAVLFVSNNAFATECIKGEREYVACGSGANKVTGIPIIIPQITSFLVALLKIAVPIVLIITGMVEMIKAIVAGNPDQVSKSKNKLIKKFVAALIAFFIVVLITTIVKMISDNNEKATFVACMSCYLNNDCDSDCSKTTYRSPEDLTKYCEDYSLNECESISENYFECKIIDNKCTTVYYECESLPQDKCNGSYDHDGNQCIQVYSGGGVKCTIKPKVTCGSYSKAECAGAYDEDGAVCTYVYGTSGVSSGSDGSCTKAKECSSYDPHSDSCSKGYDYLGRKCKIGVNGGTCIVSE